MRPFTPPCGPVVGWADGEVARATGIPYATADRFSPPVAHPDWSTPLEATEWSPACPQVPMAELDAVLGDFAGLRVDEDCLRVSVTTPRDASPDAGLPVMVWIHGGSYVAGAGDVPIMDPAPLVAEQRVVVVTVTYRLGLLGYLGDGAGRPANLGLLDQLEAFRWVARNIRAFGGDPDRVTAFGQSAGGDAVAHLMALPEAAGLFRRAIVQSAPLGISRGRRRMNAAMARASRGLTADMPVEDVVARQPAVERVAAPYGLIGAMPFGTQYGHAPLPRESDLDAAWDRAAPRVDVLIGHTAEEARLFLPDVPWLARLTRVPVVGPLVRRAAVAGVTGIIYGVPGLRFARRHARAGGTAHCYVIRWSAPGSPLGAAHTVDLPLLFGDEEAWRGAGLLAGAPWEGVQRDARRVRQVWGDFARGRIPTRQLIPGVLELRRVDG
ncbi:MULTISPECIES: carboxylesterase family protein [Clavibacter]|uniref:Carboxylesterase n=1 Tax=Clavibacter tessellarius TaxID=31965 RepID=A0A154UXH0_9MICO|nr:MULTISPECIES: carboxylesterase family protein [Clavibacter]KZC93777.1 carboxylesterase [Clavibacter michiganensis subsp. tessellarius]MDA3803529.1 carboxylesterase family protein [Clavibacter sp. CT19]